MEGGQGGARAEGGKSGKERGRKKGNGWGGIGNRGRWLLAPWRKTGTPSFFEFGAGAKAVFHRFAGEALDGLRRIVSRIAGGFFWPSSMRAMPFAADGRGPKLEALGIIG